MDFSANNEYGRLKRVLIGSIKNAPKNGLVFGGSEQNTADINRGQARLIELLQGQGVDTTVVDTGRTLGVSMAFTRDPFFVAGNNLFVQEHVAEKERAKAKSLLIKQLGIEDKSKLIYVDPARGIRLDGGDVILNNDTIYVGQNGVRSNRAGLDLIDRHLGNDFNIVPMNMMNDETGRPILHLDCVFNTLSRNDALLYPKGLSRRAQNEILNNFNVTEVTGEEQRRLGTNVLNLGNRHVISQESQGRINAELEGRGFHVHPINFGNTMELGGAFRCTASVLGREKE